MGIHASDGSEAKEAREGIVSPFFNQIPQISAPTEVNKKAAEAIVQFDQTSLHKMANPGNIFTF